MPHFHHHDHHGGQGGPRQSAPSLPPPSKPSTDYVVLDPGAVRFRRGGERLELRQDGDDWLQVTLVRLFPLTEQRRWLSVLDADGNEVGILLDLARLPKESRSAAEEELQRRYLVPEIVRIISCRALRHGLTRWTVETDKGEATFITRHLREMVKEPIPTRISLVDVEGNRYDVPDIAALDPESRALLQTRI